MNRDKMWENSHKSCRSTGSDNLKLAFRSKTSESDRLREKKKKKLAKLANFTSEARLPRCAEGRERAKDRFWSNRRKRKHESMKQMRGLRISSSPRRKTFWPYLRREVLLLKPKRSLVWSDRMEGEKGQGLLYIWRLATNHEHALVHPRSISAVGLRRGPQESASRDEL